MKRAALEWLFCPACRGRLEPAESSERRGEIHTGTLRCRSCGEAYPIVGYIPRLIKGFNYSDSWGELWKNTGQALWDSRTGLTWHRDVIHGLYSADPDGPPHTTPFGFRWPERLEGETILEIGPGTGNCTEHLVATGAEVLSVDMSDAVDSLPESLLTLPNLHVVQGDVNSGILAEERFDRIWMFQVLQHTPSPAETLKQVKRFLKPGGELAVTQYAGRFRPWFYAVTKRIPSRLSWRLINRIVPPLVPLKYRLLRFADRLGSRFLFKAVSKLLEPVDPHNLYFLTLEGRRGGWLVSAIYGRNRNVDDLVRFVILNTFDTITPQYTNCCPDFETMTRWADGAGFASFHVFGAYNLRARR